MITVRGRLVREWLGKGDKNRKEIIKIEKKQAYPIIKGSKKL
jgi:hypothetical protein